MKKYYLSHSTEIRHKVRKWELLTESKIDISLINPFYDLLGHIFEQIDNGVISLNAYRSTRPKGEIVCNDLDAVKNSDGIIAFIEKPSFGTAMELFYCKTVLNKPIYIYVKDSKLKDHPWLSYCSDFITTDIDSFNNKLRELSKE